MNYPKVLILCSEDIFETNSSGSFTIRSLFGSIPTDNIFQVLCFDNQTNAGRIDSHHYVLNGNNIVLGRFLKRRNKQRNAIIPTKDVVKSNKNNISLKSIVKSKVIDLYKSLPYYVSKDLLDYIKESNVDIIYTATSMPRVLRLMNSLSVRFHIPAIPHFFDDWPNISFDNSAILRVLFQANLNKVIHNAPFCLCISQLMCDEYTKRYQYYHFMPFMHSVKREECDEEAVDGTLNLLYAGSLYLGRYETLLTLCDIVQKHKVNSINIEIYTKNDAWEELKSFFSPFTFVKYGGFIGQEELMNRIRKSDGLLFFESFFEDILSYTRLSLSTKVPEYLSSGKRIFAAGHAEQGSIKYLSDNNAAYVALDKESLEPVFLDFINRKNEEQILKNACELYNNNHDINKQQSKFLRIIQDSLSNEETINNNTRI